MTTPRESAASETVISRYSSLARTALAAEAIAACDPDALAEGRFGAACSGAEAATS